MEKEFEGTKRKTILEMFKEIKELEVADSPLMTVEDCLPFMCEKVEQALTELKAIKEAKPSEALEGLKHIKKYYVPEPCSTTTYDYLEIIEQVLLKAQVQEKVLEIIKEKGVNVGEFKKELDWDKFDYSFYLCYYKRFSIEELTKEEFDLLKRCLENE